MDPKNPDGYQNLLVYQKAQKLHNDVLEMVKYFPQLPYRHTQYQDKQIKTMGDLADQMSRSGRSTHKNIVEGWKRTTTKEYFDFLSFSMGSNGELKDDARDIVCGKYSELMGVKGVMGERGNLFCPLTPLPPFDPFIIERLESLKFYPLDSTLAPAVKIYLQAKEVDYLLFKLQKSLDDKMDSEHTKPVSQMIRQRMNSAQQADKEFKDYLSGQGLKRLENGRLVGPEDPDYGFAKAL